ncbi:MAG: APC family permease [Acidimicrobiales bacterium]
MASGPIRSGGAPGGPGSGAGEAMAPGSSDRGLSHSLSAWHLYFLIVSAMVGSGWLFAALGADTTAGPAAVVSWVIGGVLALLIALSYAEVAGMLPRSGAVVRYPHLTHGGMVGYILGWAYLLWSFAIPALEAEAVVTYASSYLPGLTAVKAKTTVLVWPGGILMALALMVVFFVINYYGVRWVGRTNTLLSIWKLAVPTFTFLLLFITSFHGANYSSYGGFAPFGVKPIFATVVSSGITFSILGFRQALEYGGEARNPQRDIPRATILGLLTGIVLYVLLQLAFTGSINWASAGVAPGHWAGLQAGHWAAAPFADALKASGIAFLGAFSTLLLADAYVSPGATGFVYLGTGTRVLYGLSANRYLPAVFRKLTATKIPIVSLAAAFVVGCAFFVPFPSWYTAVGLVSSAAVLTYLMGGIGLQVMRRTAPELPRRFRLGAAGVLAPAGTVAAAVIVYWSGYAVLVDVAAAVMLILPVWSWFYAPERRMLGRSQGAAIGGAFLVAWVATQVYGNWVLTPATLPLSAHPAFPLFFALMVLEVVAFNALCWALASPAGRNEVSRAWWLEAFMLVMLALSYYGGYGPLSKPVIGFPWDTVIALVIGLVAYYWAVASGYATPEMKAITATGSGLNSAELEAGEPYPPTIVS